MAVEPAAVMLPVSHCVALPPDPAGALAAAVPAAPAVAADVGAAVAAADGDALELLLQAARTIEAMAIKTPKRAI
jgi:hypothetical protein